MCICICICVYIYMFVYLYFVFANARLSVCMSFFIKAAWSQKKPVKHTHTLTQRNYCPAFAHGTNLNLIHALNCFGACDSVAVSATATSAAGVDVAAAAEQQKGMKSNCVHKSYKCCRSPTCSGGFQ